MGQQEKLVFQHFIVPWFVKLVTISLRTLFTMLKDRDRTHRCVPKEVKNFLTDMFSFILILCLNSFQSCNNHVFIAEPAWKAQDNISIFFCSVLLLKLSLQITNDGTLCKLLAGENLVIYIPAADEMVWGPWENILMKVLSTQKTLSLSLSNILRLL